MASGVIKRPTGDSITEDVSNDFSSEYYSRTNNDPIKYFRNGNVVVLNATITVNTPYTSFPGITVLGGLPTPTNPVTISFPSFGTDVAHVSLWIRVTAVGNLNLRFGTAGRSYNVNFTYICS